MLFCKSTVFINYDLIIIYENIPFRSSHHTHINFLNSVYKLSYGKIFLADLEKIELSKDVKWKRLEFAVEDAEQE